MIIPWAYLLLKCIFHKGRVFCLLFLMHPQCLEQCTAVWIRNLYRDSSFYLVAKCKLKKRDRRKKNKEAYRCIICNTTFMNLQNLHFFFFCYLSYSRTSSLSLFCSSHSLLLFKGKNQNLFSSFTGKHMLISR